MGAGGEGGRAPDVRAATGARGRPRDPDTAHRALEAALTVFGERGLSGLTFDEVAARSRVGKSSIYLRWPDKTALLVEALRLVQIEDLDVPDDAGAGRTAPGRVAPESSAPGDTAPGPVVPDSVGPDPAGPGRGGAPEAAGASSGPMTLRDYLVAHAHRRASLYLGRYGLAMLRLYAEARAQPEMFAEIREQAISRFVRDERARVADAVRSGVLPPDASPVRILDAVEGAIFMHVLVTPPQLIDRVRASLDEYIALMVDDQLRAAGYHADADLLRNRP